MGRREYSRPTVIVRLLPLLNEADILERNLAWYADAGIATVAFDNASTDATTTICHAALNDGRLAGIERSDQPVAWAKVGSALLDLAKQLDPTLVIVAGADEFVEVADGTPLRTAIETDLTDGHDVLEVRTMEFCLTDEDDPAQQDPILRMRRYSAHTTVMSDRGMRYSCGLRWDEPHDLCALGGQAQRSPRRYINRHYPLRSADQALARAHAGRLRPVLAGSSAGGGAAYVKTHDELVLPARKLPRYADDHHWTYAPLAAELRLAAASQRARRTASEERRLRRELTTISKAHSERGRRLADLQQRYSHVLLERDRLAAAGATPLPGHLAASAGWYDEQYRLQPGKYDSHYAESVYLPVWQEIADRIDRRANVLEIGCGTGQLAHLLADRGVEHYTGFDFSTYAIELARRRLPGIKLLVADVRTTALFDEATYDVVVCTEVLEHLDEDVGVLKALNPGARILATVPSFDSASHLRFFADEQAVSKRYRHTLANLSVTPFSLSSQSALFLLDGFVPRQQAHGRQ